MNNYIVDNNTVITEIMGQYILVALKTADRKRPCIRQLNSTGAFIWKMLEQKKRMPEIVDAVCSRFDLNDTSKVEQDLRLFMKSLCDAGYLIMDEPV